MAIEIKGLRCVIAGGKVFSPGKKKERKEGRERERERVRGKRVGDLLEV